MQCRAFVCHRKGNKTWVDCKRLAICQVSPLELQTQEAFSRDRGIISSRFWFVHILSYHFGVRPDSDKPWLASNVWWLPSCRFRTKQCRKPFETILRCFEFLHRSISGRAICCAAKSKLFNQWPEHFLLSGTIALLLSLITHHKILWKRPFC